MIPVLNYHKRYIIHKNWYTEDVRFHTSKNRNNNYNVLPVVHTSALMSF